MIERIQSFYEFCTKLNEELIKEENELNSIKTSAIENHTFMKAPNGNHTNLNEKQWLQVRTKAFKDWFGDWENDRMFNSEHFCPNKLSASAAPLAFVTAH